MKIVPLAALIPVAVLISSCAPKINNRSYEAQSASGPGDFADVSPHRSERVHGNNDVRFNYLDWGGSGPTLVLIHDIGDSPHIYDDLAPRLKRHFRVIAIARRGHGLSAAPEGPYDQGTLVYDIYKLFESIGIDKASLLGWGAAGSEITAFAARFADRVDRLIYLDAGYDFSDPAFMKAMHDVRIATSASQAAMGSLDAYRSWYRTARLGPGTDWNAALEAYIRDANVISADGTVSPVTHDRIMNALFAGLTEKRPDYGAVKARALALYASSFYPVDQGDAALSEKVRNFEDNVMKPFREASMQRIASELRNVQVTQMADRTHASIGVRSADSLSITIRDFLLADR
jgi:pimeloyl-ACP methyl ester carboxylesterase